jgi:hypothetical protein
MKKVVAACVEQILEFDSESSFERYIENLKSRKQWFEIVYKVHNSDVVMVRIKKQYNRHVLLG